MDTQILQALSNYIRETDLPTEVINGRRVHEILALLSQDRSRHSIIFEYVCALEFGLVPWTWLDPDLLNRISA